MGELYFSKRNNNSILLQRLVKGRESSEYQGEKVMPGRELSKRGTEMRGHAA